jgi:hypothetical protein
MNPWLLLPNQPNYWLEIDYQSIVNFNNINNKPPYDIIGHILPEPFVGSPDAEIILLNLNPGFAGNQAHLETMGNSNFVNDSLLNLSHQINNFFLLHHQGPGQTWWKKKFKYLIENCGIDKTNNLMCIEWFPYSSEKFHRNYWRRNLLPSQAYSFDLVRRFMKEGRIIIIMRSQDIWFETIPQLQNYPKLMILNNFQNPTITPNNLTINKWHLNNWKTIHNIICP